MLAATLLQLPDFGSPDNPIDVLSSVRPITVAWAIVVAFLTWLLVRTSFLGLNAMALRAPRARFFFKMLDPIIRFILWSIGLFLILSIFAPSQETLFAVVASVGIALGLGAQDLVKNVIGGLVILVDRPYQPTNCDELGNLASSTVSACSIHVEPNTLGSNRSRKER